MIAMGMCRGKLTFVIFTQGDKTHQIVVHQLSFTCTPPLRTIIDGYSITRPVFLLTGRLTRGVPETATNRYDHHYVFVNRKLNMATFLPVIASKPTPQQEAGLNQNETKEYVIAKQLHQKAV